MYRQYKQGLFQSRLGTADYALVTSSFHYNDSLVTWTVIHMTAAKFNPVVTRFFFGIPIYLQAVQIHVANVV
jgi:hypothetical protein